MEHWILVRKPLDGTVAANVAKHGTGALNIDACRLSSVAEPFKGGTKRSGGIMGKSEPRGDWTPSGGRWPANVTLDEEAAALLDEQSGELISGFSAGFVGEEQGSVAMGRKTAMIRPESVYADRGGASRFFYVAKPDGREREIGLDGMPRATRAEATDRKEGSAGASNPRAGAGSKRGRANIHPTVKSVDLMRWLCRLITPKGGLVLDPFMGSGSTGIACAREGMRFIGIERERAYFEIARRRFVGDAPLLNQLPLRGPGDAA